MYQCAESQSHQQQGHSELVPRPMTLGIYFANQACFSSWAQTLGTRPLSLLDHRLLRILKTSLVGKVLWPT